MAVMRLGILLNVAAATLAVIDIPRLDVPFPGKALAKAPLVSWNNGAFDLVYQSHSGRQLVGRLGSDHIPAELGVPNSCDSAGLCWTFNSQVSLTFTLALGGKCYSVEWQTDFDTLGDCFELEPAHWYGGAEVYEQTWPITGDTTLMGEGEQDMAYVTGDFFQRKFAGVMEPYWINSDGFGIRPLRENALFVSWNSSGSGQLCLNARHAYPYPPKDRQETSKLSLQYLLCSTSNVKEMHTLALTNNFWDKPRSVVDERMLTHPVWSTWARYKTLINQDRINSFAEQIRQYGFNDSQLEIDDRWEDCYGEHQFDTTKFPDPAAMVSNLHDQGFRVTLWIHPFINSECPSFSSASEHVVRNANGQPALTSWWQGNSAGYFDYTRQSAADWWSARITKLSTDYGLDGFKVDAGETNWLPADFDFTNLLPVNSTPNGYSTAYARNMERFGKMTEIRTGWASQDVPIFTRMLDKSTYWGITNGLATLIPTLLHFSVIGYSFVLPDMIGGNGYNGRPSKELFVRWMQANVFMPAMQFSYTPWDFDDEVVAISQRMTMLHYQYAPTIISLANQATVDGTPINRPLWWIDPLDPVALTSDSEYLLGDDVLVAPVLESGAITRDIYLPSGTWRDEVDSTHAIYTGPVWLRDYPAPLDTLPYFTRV